VSVYDAMTLDELQTEFARLAEQLAPIQEARSEIDALIKRRTSNVVATAKVAAMSDVERDAMRSALDVSLAQSAPSKAVA
jgi:hypothetical protein